MPGDATGHYHCTALTHVMNSAHPQTGRPKNARMPIRVVWHYSPVSMKIDCLCACRNVIELRRRRLSIGTSPRAAGVAGILALRIVEDPGTPRTCRA